MTIQIDDPIELDGNYEFDKPDRRKIDDQIITLQHELSELSETVYGAGGGGGGGGTSGGSLNNTSTGAIVDAASVVTGTPVDTLRFTGAAPVVSGIASGTTARRIVVSAVGGSLVLSNEGSGSTSTNRIVTGTSVDMTISKGSSAILEYDATTARWRVVGNGDSTLSILWRPSNADMGVSHVKTWVEVQAWITSNLTINSRAQLTVFVDDGWASPTVPNTVDFDLEKRVTFSSLNEDGAGFEIADGGRLRNLTGLHNVEIFVQPTSVVPIYYDATTILYMSGNAKLSMGGSSAVAMVSGTGAGSNLSVVCRDGAAQFSNASSVAMFDVSGGSSFTLTAPMAGRNYAGVYVPIPDLLVSGGASETFFFQTETAPYVDQSAFTGTVTIIRTGSSSLELPAGVENDVLGLGPTGDFKNLGQSVSLPDDVVTGDVLYYDGSNLSRVSGVLTEGYVITAISGVPTWAAPTGGGPSFDISSLAWNLAHRGSYASVPWAGETSAGDSALYTLTAPVDAPTVGATSGGFAAADFDGIDQGLKPGTAGPSYINWDAIASAGAYYGFAVINLRSAAAAAGNIFDNPQLVSDNGGNMGVALSTSGVAAYHTDVVTAKVTGWAPLSTGSYHLVEWWFDGAFLHIAVDGAEGTPVATTTASFLGAVTVNIGRDYASVNHADMLLEEIRVAPTDLSSNSADISTYAHARYAF